MTSHAPTIAPSFDYQAPSQEWVAAWRRHAFVFPAMFVAMSVCFWFVTTGDGKLFHREYFCGFYDAQARSILHAHLDVPAKAIGFEAFDHNGKTYGYFGITPALLRIPLVIIFRDMDGRWSRMMMLVACGINLVCAYRIVLFVTRPDRPTTVGQMALVFFFVLCAGIGSTTIFLVSRTYVYHEAIMWGSTFALLFVDRLLAYLSAPGLGLLATAGACAFLSFHARATAGAGALLAMCVLTLALVVRVMQSRSATHKSKRAFGAGSASSLGIPSAAGALAGGFVASMRFSPARAPAGLEKFSSSLPTTSSPSKIAVRDADPTRVIQQPALHAAIAGLTVALTIGAYLGINYAKFGTFEGVPVRLYRMYTTNPERMRITGGRQFHLENVPTGIASYFSFNGLSFGPEFPWVYMVERARVLGKPALDVVEPYSGIPVSMPAFFFLALAGIQPVLRGKTQAMRQLRLPAITLLLGGGVILATVGITERYLHDFYPWLIVLGAAGVYRSMRPGHERAKIAIIVLLSVVSIALNCAFALNFQRDYVWGEPQATREEFVSTRQVINRVLHRPPPPAVKEQP